MYSSYNPVLKAIRYSLILIAMTSLHTRGSADINAEDPEKEQNTLYDEYDEHDEYDDESRQEKEEENFEGKRISSIIISGNHLVPDDAIKDRIPYHVGELFDPTKTRKLIHNLYYDLKRFRNISVYAKKGDNDTVVLQIVLEEKPLLNDVVIEGNKKVTEKEIREKIPFASIQALDEQELKQYAQAINKLYKEKGFHNTRIDSSFVVNEKNQATATFTITEYKKSLVKKINFKGNHFIGAKKLRTVLFTREDWLLSFMDKAGIFQYERIDADKHMIEQFYQNNGFINAKVADVDVHVDEKSNSVYLTYEIVEGDKYTVSDVKAYGNDILKDEFLSSILPIVPGDIYSRQQIVNSIKALEFVWGDMGYVYAHIEPSIIPNDDTKTVSISFNSDIGSPVFLNKLTIRGNRKTRDKVIRRKISLEEGSLVTNRHMEGSKNRIEALGFFDQRDGVNWKMTRLDENTADLDLIVKETKTGSAHAKLGFGGSAASISSATTGVSLELNTADTNLFGSGMRYSLTGRLGGDEKTVVFNLTQPWLFDKPVFGSMDLYHKRVSYDEFQQTRPVNEKHSGGVLTTGFVTGAWHTLITDTFIRFSFGIDDIRYENRITDGLRNAKEPLATLRMDILDEQESARQAYDQILRKLFDPGTFLTFTTQMGRDTKNHPMHPSRGYAWLARSVFAIPSFNSDIGFHKFDFDINWLTPLIGDYDLIFRVHMYCGLVSPFSKRFVPYRELFHIGGPASVRGFLYGQIGPQFSTEYAGRRSYDSIGAKKTVFLNTELIFPITNDFSMKGVIFYDGGAGWDNPYKNDIPSRFLLNNSFNYRHAVGVGIRLIQPMPIKVDWGFKLDARKGESPYEVHFGMTYDW